MNALPAEFLEDGADREPLAALSTVDSNGTPNVIWVLCLHLIPENACLMIADNAMDKTRSNLEAGSPGALVMLALPRRAWQLKGKLSYYSEGALFDDMKHGWLDSSFPGRGVVRMELQELWQGAELLWQRDERE